MAKALTGKYTTDHGYRNPRYGRGNISTTPRVRLQINIMGISEMRWTDAGKCVINEHHIQCVRNW